MKNALVLLLLTTTPATAHDWCADREARSEFLRARAWGRLCLPAIEADMEFQRMAANQQNLAAHLQAPPRPRSGPGIVTAPGR